MTASPAPPAVPPVPALPALGLVGLVYILGRSAGLIGGARLETDPAKVAAYRPHD